MSFNVTFSYMYLIYFDYNLVPNIHTYLPYMTCSWALMSSLEEGRWRGNINNIDTGSPVKGIPQSYLFSNEKNLIHPASTQVFWSIDIAWSAIIG